MEGVQHKLSLVNRQYFALEGVVQIESSDEKEIVLETKMGFLFLQGDDLHITQLNLEDGEMKVEGYIKVLEFNDAKMGNKGKSFLNRILK